MDVALHRAQGEIQGRCDLRGRELQLRGDCIGALNLYRDRIGEFKDHDIRLAHAFADVAAIAILQEPKIADARRRADHLLHALDSRVLIEQAKGILAAKLDLTPSQAFHRLRDHAPSHNAKVRDISRRIIDEDFFPD